MSVDFHQLLTGLTSISRMADFGLLDGADHVNLLFDIREKANDLLTQAGWEVPVSEPEEEDDGEEVEVTNVVYRGGYQSAAGYHE